MNERSQARPIRWRWAAGILILAAIALAVIWSRDIQRQDRIIASMITGMITLTLLFLWAVLFSRFRGRTRAIIFAGGLVLGITLAKSVEIAGVSGDLIPIFRWKWNKNRTIEVAKAGEVKLKATSASFPQFLGPDRNGIIHGVRLETNWTAHPPQELWRHPVGSAWSGFAIVDGIAITQEQHGENELVTAYDLETGKLIWSHTDKARYATTIAGEGPRATPTIRDRRVYTFGATGALNCLDLANGNVIWTKNLLEEHSAKVPEWGFAGSPLVHENIVVVNAGAPSNRSLVAHDAATGKFIWGGGNDSAGYSAPTVLEFVGQKQAIIFTRSHVEGHDVASGKVLWAHPWNTSTPHCTMPIQISNNRLLSSQGYGYGSELLELSRTNGAWNVERVWKSNRLKSKFANLILHDGFVYSLDDGILTCLDPSNGDRKWHGERYGHGQLLLVENLILLSAENGEVLLIDPSPEAERVVARFRALTSKTWNPPALVGEYLLVRTDLEAACFKLPLASERRVANHPPEL